MSKAKFIKKAVKAAEEMGNDAIKKTKSLFNPSTEEKQKMVDLIKDPEYVKKTVDTALDFGPGAMAGMIKKGIKDISVHNAAKAGEEAGEEAGEDLISESGQKFINRNLAKKELSKPPVFQRTEPMLGESMHQGSKVTGKLVNPQTIGRTDAQKKAEFTLGTLKDVINPSKLSETESLAKAIKGAPKQEQSAVLKEQSVKQPTSKRVIDENPSPADLKRVAERELWAKLKFNNRKAGTKYAKDADKTNKLEKGMSDKDVAFDDVAKKSTVDRQRGTDRLDFLEGLGYDVSKRKEAYKKQYDVKEQEAFEKQYPTKTKEERYAIDKKREDSPEFKEAQQKQLNNLKKMLKGKK